MTTISTFGALKTGTAFAAVAFGLSISTATATPSSINSLVKTQYRSTTTLPNDNRRILKSASSSSTCIPYFVESLDTMFGEKADRQTSEKEKLIGEVRSWAAFTADWDGEGASSPNKLSLEAASNFIRSLPGTIIDAAPMINANGRAGLFWNSHDFYADLEFLGDGRIAYFIQKSDDRHKGLLHFDSKFVPPVLSTLLELAQTT